MNDKVEELEAAILARAESLAEQYRRQAEVGRENLLREAGEKLRLREEREVLIGKSMADRAYKREVQAQELKLQARMDQMRWNLVRSVHEKLLTDARELVVDEARYRPILHSWLRQGIERLTPQTLVVQVNETDRNRLSRDWETFSTNPEGKQIMLGEKTLDCIGGMIIRSTDNRLRLDNTIEGRLHRLRVPIDQCIQTHLVNGEALEAP